MDVKKTQKSDENLRNKNYYEAVSKVLTFVDKVDKIKNKKKKGDSK